jgi:hypothetical protein
VVIERFGWLNKECIVLVFGLSVFWLLLSKALGIKNAIQCEWKISMPGWIFKLFLVLQGSSAP